MEKLEKSDKKGYPLLLASLLLLVRHLLLEAMHLFLLCFLPRNHSFWYRTWNPNIEPVAPQRLHQKQSTRPQIVCIPAVDRRKNTPVASHQKLRRFGGVTGGRRPSGRTSLQAMR